MVRRSRTRRFIHLDAEAVAAIHAEVIAAHGGRPGIRDRALLESAVAAPQASHAGKPLIADAIGVDAFRRAPVTSDVVLMSLTHGKRMHEPLQSHI